MENRFCNFLQTSKFRLWRKGEVGVLGPEETQGIQKTTGKCSKCYATPEISKIETVKSNFPETCTVAVILHRLCLFWIEDKIPCLNLPFIKPKRK